MPRPILSDDRGWLKHVLRVYYGGVRRRPVACVERARRPKPPRTPEEESAAWAIVRDALRGDVSRTEARCRELRAQHERLMSDVYTTETLIARPLMACLGRPLREVRYWVLAFDAEGGAFDLAN